MASIYCANCGLWDACNCPRAQIAPVRRTPRAKLVLRGLLHGLEFWVASPAKRRAMVREALSAVERARKP